ncbi:MAG: DsbA family protein [Solirubrobacterales bacterium]
MTRNAKLTLILVSVLVLGGLVAIVLGSSSGEEPQTASSDGGAEVIRDDSHRLSTAPEGQPTLVEFLDFECEGCGALYPIMEELRSEYDGEVIFAIRYFPNEGHFNAMNSALAVEAAARQGKLEPMYEMMFETQAEWGEAQESKAAVFTGFARELGLDMAQYRRDVKDPKAATRIERDRDEGLALGVEGTPSLFLDGEPLTPESHEQMKAEIDAALEQ